MCHHFSNLDLFELKAVVEKKLNTGLVQFVYRVIQISNIFKIKIILTKDFVYLTIIYTLIKLSAYFESLSNPG